MIGLAPLALFFAQSAAVQTPGEAVAQLFIDACLNGALRLGKDRAEVVEPDSLPALVRGQMPGEYSALGKSHVDKMTVIKVTDPASTYVFMATYKVEKPHRGNPAAGCTVMSRAISLEEGAAFFIKLAPEARMRTGRWDGQWPAHWTREVPEKGYTVRMRGVKPGGLKPGWVVLEAATYPPKTR
jgi:hypothetical protein